MKKQDSVIALNKKALADYHVHDRFEAGIALLGWEVKGLREGKAQITDTHGLIRKGEMFLLGMRIQSPSYAVTYIKCDETRTKKLLLKRREIDKIEGLVNRAGYSLVPLKLYWKDGRRVKCEIALVSGKKQFDRREEIKERDWQREQQRIVKRLR